MESFQIQTLSPSSVFSHFCEVLAIFIIHFIAVAAWKPCSGVLCFNCARCDRWIFGEIGNCISLRPAFGVIPVSTTSRKSALQISLTNRPKSYYGFWYCPISLAKAGVELPSLYVSIEPHLRTEFGHGLEFLLAIETALWWLDFLHDKHAFHGGFWACIHVWEVDIISHPVGLPFWCFLVVMLAVASSCSRRPRRALHK